jgi:hypothetical protein
MTEAVKTGSSQTVAALGTEIWEYYERVATASSASQWHGMHERLSVVGGDFLSSVPPADLYLLKHILHDWDSASCVRILNNCRRSLRSDGRVVVIEQQFGEMDQPGLTPILDLVMLVMVTGRERTLAEYEVLFICSGFAPRERDAHPDGQGSHGSCSEMNVEMGFGRKS